LNKTEEAIRNYIHAIEINPRYAEAYYNNGNALFALKKTEEAIRNYDKVIEINPQYLDAFSTKGLALLSLNKKEEEIRNIEKALEYSGVTAEEYAFSKNVCIRKFYKFLTNKFLRYL
jgi:tetratricopeptide (TPR) repeat protein